MIRTAFEGKRKRKMVKEVLMTPVLLGALLLSMGIVPVEAQLPAGVAMVSHSMSGGHKILIPKGVKRVRGILMVVHLNDAPGEPGLPEVMACRLWDFALLELWYPKVTDGQLKGKFQEVFDEAAKKSGHPEIANLPVLYQSGRWIKEEIVSQFSDRMLAMTLFDSPEAAKVAPKALGIAFDYESQHASNIPKLPERAKAVRAQGMPVCYLPVWGWSRGAFQSGDYMWKLFDWVVRNRLPQGETPADGKVALKDIRLEDGWLGDPSTWTGEWPQAYRYAEFKGDKSLAPWIPDEEMAVTWRALASRDPIVKNMQSSTFGIRHTGSHQDNTFGLSSPPRIGVLAPVRIHNQSSWKPVMVLKDSVVKFEVRSDLENLKDFILYDGTQEVGRGVSNAYKIWHFRCAMKTAGIRPMIVHATLTDGKRVTSWPAIIFVDKVAAGKQTAGMAGQGLRPDPASHSTGGRVSWTGNPGVSGLAWRLAHPHRRGETMDLQGRYFKSDRLRILP